MWKRLHTKYLLLLSDFNETRIFSTDFRKNWNIKFRQHSSSGSRVVSYGRTDTTKLIVALRSFANAPTNKLRRTWVSCRLLRFLDMKLYIRTPISGVYQTYFSATCGLSAWRCFHKLPFHVLSIFPCSVEHTRCSNRSWAFQWQNLFIKCMSVPAADDHRLLWPSWGEKVNNHSNCRRQ